MGNQDCSRDKVSTHSALIWPHFDASNYNAYLIPKKNY